MKRTIRVLAIVDLVLLSPFLLLFALSFFVNSGPTKASGCSSGPGCDSLLGSPYFLLAAVSLSVVVATLCAVMHGADRPSRWFRVFVILTAVLVLSPTIAFVAGLFPAPAGEYGAVAMYAIAAVASVLALVSSAGGE